MEEPVIGEETRKSRIWLALAPAMVVPFAASLFYFALFSDRYFARVIFGATKMFTVVWPVISVWFIFRTALPRMDLGHPRHRRAIALGVVVGIAIALLMFGAMRTPLGEVVAGSSEAIRSKARELGIVEYFWPIALSLSFVNSLVEEYYWRWFVFGHLRFSGVPVPLAHVLAGIAFAAHHTVITTQFFPVAWGLAVGGLVGVGGVIWSVMYARQGTLLGVWVSHMIADLAIMCIGYNLLFAK